MLRLKVSFFSLASGYLLLFVAFIMQLVMNTASDRVQYLQMFSAPFGNERIEIGFQYYMQLLKLAGISPDIGIVFTCLVIFVFLARVWFSYVTLKWLESLLLFNFFTFSLFQAYLGASIRMGLAISLALYASVRLLRGDSWFLLALWITPLFHYGAIPFALIVTWVWFTRNLLWRTHKILIALGCVTFFLLINFLLDMLGLSAYYMQYFEGELGQTQRVVPFTGVFFALAVAALSINTRDGLSRRVIFYGLPFFFFGVFGGFGAPIFFRMLIPNIFMAAVLVVVEYKQLYVTNVTPELRLYLASIFNGFALLYALHAYNYM